MSIREKLAREERRKPLKRLLVVRETWESEFTSPSQGCEDNWTEPNPVSELWGRLKRGSLTENYGKSCSEGFFGPWGGGRGLGESPAWAPGCSVPAITSIFLMLICKHTTGNTHLSMTFHELMLYKRVTKSELTAWVLRSRVSHPSLGNQLKQPIW